MTYNNFDNYTHWYNNFQYWFAHWCAFNMTAMNLGVWRFHHLFHDWYKPIASIFVDYSKVDKFHIEHSSHHIEHYRKTGKLNVIDLCIDWECSQYTKEKGKLSASDYLDKMKEWGKLSDKEYMLIEVMLIKLTLR